MRIARNALSKDNPSSPRITELDTDLKDFLTAVREDRISHGWFPYPEIEPEDGQKARVELATGEVFDDTYYGGMWLAQKDSDVIAWTPCH